MLIASGMVNEGNESRLRSGQDSEVSRRDYNPASLLWCIKKPGRALHEKTELWLAWKRVFREVADGTLGADFDRADRAEITAKVADAEDHFVSKENRIGRNLRAKWGPE
jgi:hypothetical protein